MISNTGKLRKADGFTIVELLIVIVVIGILAAITIVTYSGVQARAKTNKLDITAKEIADKIEVYAIDEDKYPGALTGADSLVTPDKAYTLSAAARTAAQTGTATADKVQVTFCGTSPNFTGAQVTPWSYIDKTPATGAKVRVAGTCP